MTDIKYRLTNEADNQNGNERKENMSVKKLSELCTAIVDCPHSTPQWMESGKIVLRNQFIKGGRLDLTSPSFTDEESFFERCRRAKPAQGDIVITREAPMGEVCMIPRGVECCLGQRMVLLKVNKELCNNRYLLYALMSPYVQNQISWNEGTGTTVSNLRIPTLSGLEVPYLPIEEQNVIADTLSCLDEKIDINKKIIKNLEAQVQAIFLDCFINLEKCSDSRPMGVPPVKLPDGWRIGSIGELIENIIGGDWGKENKTETHTEETYCIRGTDIPDILKGELTRLPVRFLLKKYYDVKKLNKNDIVVEISGGSPMQATGRVAIITEALLERYSKGMVCTNFCKLLRPKSGYTYYIFYLWQHLYNSGVMFSYENGTTGIKNFDLKGFISEKTIIIPSVEAVNNFEKLTEPFLKTIFSYGKQSQTLNELRDRLLPGLINGEIPLS